jgi:hypothetical protein
MEPTRVQANHSVTKRLGNWTTANAFRVRAHRGVAVLDLRSPQIPDGDVRVDAELDHAVLKLLLPEDMVVDDWELRRVTRGRVKDMQPASGPGRRVVLTGKLRSGEVRVHRGGIAILSALFTRGFLTDARRAHREGGRPTVHDPAAQSR